MSEVMLCSADELFKGVAHFQDVIFDPKTAFSEEVNETGFQRALGTDLDQWAYYDTAEGQYRGKRFAAAMSAASKLHPPQAVLTGEPDLAVLTVQADVVDRLRLELGAKKWPRCRRRRGRRPCWA